MADVCVRFKGSDGTVDVACRVDLLRRGSVVLRELLSPELQAELPFELRTDSPPESEPGLHGLPVLAIENPRIPCTAMRDALDYAQEPECIAGWEWTRAMALREPCRYLGVSTKEMLLQMAGRADVYTQCIELVESFDARDFSAGDLDSFTTALANATFTVYNALDQITSQERIAAVSAAVPLTRFLGHVKPRLSELSVDAMSALTAALKDVVSYNATRYVGFAARAPEECANIDAMHDLETVCDMAILVGTPPVVVAAALACRGRLDDAMYDRVITANMDLVSGLDFPLLMGLSEAAGRVDSHRVVAELATRMPGGASWSSPPPYRNASMAFLLDSRDHAARVRTFLGTHVALADAGDHVTIRADEPGSWWVFVMAIDAAGQAVMGGSVSAHVQHMFGSKEIVMPVFGNPVGHRVFVAVMCTTRTPFETRLSSMEVRAHAPVADMAPNA